MARADLRALEGRAGGRGTGEHAGLVAQEDLGIGAHVHDQHEVVGGLRFFRQRHGGGIRADMARDAGQDVDLRRGRDAGQPDFGRAEAQAARGGEREGGLPQFHRVDAQKQVVHHRVADHHRFEDQARVDARFRRDLGGQHVERGLHGARHLGIAAGVHHDIADAAHQVFAEADLRVHQPGGGQHAPVGQVAQMRGDCGGAEVDGETVEPALVEAGPDGEDMADIGARRLVQRDGDLPVALAQRRLQCLEDGQGGQHGVDPPLRFQRGRDPLHVAGGFVHVGLHHLDHHQARGRVHGDRLGGGRLAHDLAVDLAFGGHVDDDIAHDLGLAAEAAAFLEPAHAVIAGLDLVPVAERAVAHGDAVLGEIAVGGRDLAFGADAAPAANRIQIDAQVPRGGQDRGAGGEAAALAGGGEDDEGVLAAHGRVGPRGVVTLPNTSAVRGRGHPKCVLAEAESVSLLPNRPASAGYRRGRHRAWARAGAWTGRAGRSS